ncbi:dihydrodipicolinate synthase family protein [Rugosimonospora acidiphila]|uniref:Dihydrodipicolinate synthase family protein n=1 Tax=Rugosimonospora acidiphila TaxID=556531 RepID=A0ABP9SKE4_9ACTN
MVATIELPGEGRHAVGRAPSWPRVAAPPRLRRAYAAAHVVAGPDGTGGSTVDWDETMAFRHGLWRLGLGVADAMDTAQRGMGMDWPTTAELIRRSAAEAASVNGALACGANTDQLDLDSKPGLVEVLEAYRQQLELIEGSGATVVLMASRALAAAANGPEDYLSVYGTLLAEVRRPVILHWLGDAFDPALTGYWGHTDLDAAADTVIELITARAEKVDGIKVSLLDKDREIDLRRRLPAGVRLYTGDDFNYPELILGDGTRHSDALLGIFDGIAAPAAAALARLDEGDTDGYLAALRPTVPLSRHIFQAPTYHYKTGLAFLAWLNGQQSHFRLIGGYETARDAAHLSRLFVLADQAGVLADPELAAYRMNGYLDGSAEGFR